MIFILLSVMLLFQMVLQGLKDSHFKIVKGWSHDTHHSGNSILDAVDPVSLIETPFSDRNCWGHDCDFDFRFAVGFSKRGLNKDIKEYKNKINGEM